MRQPLVTLPPWLLQAAGIAALAGLLLGASGVVSIPRWPAMGRQTPLDDEDVRAASLAAEDRMRAAARHVYAEKRQAGAYLEAGGPPDRGALIGSELTPLVTTLGSLDAKRIAASPDWARVLTVELARAGVRPGSVVTASFSGSFPGLNLALMCAARELGAHVLAVSSVTASTWGATDPGFTWPEIEASLVGAGLVEPATIAVSVGGEGDRGLDLDPDARALAASIADRTAAALGATRLRPASAAEALAQRVAAVDARRRGRAIAVFVNIGGTSASLGSDEAVLRLRTGWLHDAPASELGNGWLAYVARQQVPVLHLLNVKHLALRWGITP